MRSTRTDRRRDLHLTGWEADVAHLPAIHIDRRVGIKVFHIQDDAPAGPIFGNGDSAFVPGALDLAELCVLPAWVGIERLVVALHVVLCARPAGGHFVVTPSRGGHLDGVIRCGLPAPQPIDAKDRKSTRLNSSHLGISYAVFCL